ncbi:aminotransferase class IV [Aliifodinibius salicampi]|uniref:branched-chain-amino-acid transaminase n=1 Tax=Fodinibius salicampi TaxID=1920655 RepID=A0ABT3PVY2_9BACT|nr:aminotransferase class IV [Fodinibius salicampi]MCW9712015.1 aminotransferase class IV [Fodinibius salicampi]
MTDNGHIIHNGALLSAETPIVSANSRALLYGEGAFETIRTYGRETLFFSEHLDRLKRGLNKLGINLDQFPEEKLLEEQILELLSKDNLLIDSAIVRLQFWRDGSRGYLAGKNEVELQYLITASECPDFKDREVRLATVATSRIPSESLPGFGKFTNGINYILAAKEAADKGADDALMQTTEGWISEATIANIFWIEGDNVFTPSEACDLLPGITRDIVIDIVNKNSHLRIQEGRYPMERLYEAESVAICNSVREVLPVCQINTHKFGTDHSILNQLRKDYTTFRNKYKKPLSG